MQKPKLAPVGVPWMVTPSTPFLEVQESEKGTPDRLRVTFVGFFGLEVSGEAAELPSRKVPPIVQPPGEFDQTAVKEPGAYRMVRVTFLGVSESRSERIYDDLVLEDQYDWSLARQHSAASSDWRLANRIFWDKWRQTGLCPNPGMYEIDSSPRLRELISEHPAQRPLKHYLLVGHDNYIEAVALRWVWEEGQTLKGW